jgi:hypothetical protein
LITVPCCEKCNKSFSLDDEYFMVFLTMIEDTKQNGYKDKLFKKLLRIKNRENSKGFYTSIIQSFEQKNVYTPSGLILLNQPGININENRIRKTINRIIHGLVFYHTGYFSKSISSIITTDYNRIDNNMLTGLIDVIDLLKQTDPILIHDGKIFGYKYLYPKSIPKLSAFILTFFESYYVISIIEHEIID